mmetsp:Transcript_103935/g.333174  ORF Transcript_103935/g.333174 Transcript_103935/m.333174 type:complete len:213 (-) Transcript_103935:946-1584(-)
MFSPPADLVRSSRLAKPWFPELVGCPRVWDTESRRRPVRVEDATSRRCTPLQKFRAIVSRRVAQIRPACTPFSTVRVRPTCDLVSAGLSVLSPRGICDTALPRSVVPTAVPAIIGSAVLIRNMQPFAPARRDVPPRLVETPVVTKALRASVAGEALLVDSGGMSTSVRSRLVSGLVVPSSPVCKSSREAIQPLCSWRAVPSSSVVAESDYRR